MFPTPISLLVNVFGLYPAIPWFNDGEIVDRKKMSQLSNFLPKKLDHDNYFYRIRVFGDGKTVFQDTDFTWGIVGYTDFVPKSAQVISQLTSKQLRALNSHFRDQRIYKSKHPYRPVFIQLDEYLMHILSVTDADLRLSKNNIFFLDRLFNCVQRA